MADLPDEDPPSPCKAVVGAHDTDAPVRCNLGLEALKVLVPISSASSPVRAPTKTMLGRVQRSGWSSQAALKRTPPVQRPWRSVSPWRDGCSLSLVAAKRSA